MSDIEALYLQAKQVPSDINEHVDRLRRLGEECAHVTEFGARTGVSTTAWVAARPRTVVCYDLRRFAEIDRIEAAAQAAGVEFLFHVEDVRAASIASTDLLFIDTLHTFDQLRGELARHAGQARKYVVLHDTETFGQCGEIPGSVGLWPAVEEFLAAHPEWEVYERHPHNNGLTVLRRLAKEVPC